eukprot:scpid85627/ scgid7387/ 
MTSVFSDESTDGILLADASNAFNRRNRAVSLRNVQRICPELAPVLINTYRTPVRLYVGGECIMSEEGTTQGDPLAMPFYAIAMLPLVRKATNEDSIQLWFADDASAAGKLARMQAWWDVLVGDGPK